MGTIRVPGKATRNGQRKKSDNKSSFQVGKKESGAQNPINMTTFKRSPLKAGKGKL